MATELWRHGAMELAALIGKGEVSSEEVVSAHLARIDAVNPSLNAVTVVMADSALAAAKEADRRQAAGEPLGVLHGVPFTIKENIDVEGTATTQGVAVLAEAVASMDAPIVERLRAAGAIPVGRTNLPDFGLRVHTDSSLRGLTRNPWNPSVTAGGSSGGEAAALAAGMTPLGLGNDIGGSLRNPAHCCGIASLKPSMGRVPSATVIEPLDDFLAGQLMATNGPMARTVADVRTGFRVIAGPHVRSPFTVPVPLDLEPPTVPIRVALLPDPPGAQTDPGIAGVIRRAGDHLADAGYDVVEVVPPAFAETADVWGRWLLTEIQAIQPLLEQAMGPDGLTFLGFTDQVIPACDITELVHVLIERHAIARLWSEFQAEHPLLVLPVWNQPPFPHGWDIESADNARATLDIIRPVLPANLLGLPAAVVPGGVDAGLPVGVQVVGARYREDLALDAAEVIERAVGVLTPIDPVVA
jgi:amidase